MPFASSSVSTNSHTSERRQPQRRAAGRAAEGGCIAGVLHEVLASDQQCPHSIAETTPLLRRSVWHPSSSAPLVAPARSSACSQRTDRLDLYIGEGNGTPGRSPNSCHSYADIPSHAG